MRWSGLPLGRQLTLTVAIVSGIALLLASLAFMAYDRVSIAQSQVRRLTAEAQIVGYNSATAPLFEDPDAAGTTLAALRADLSVVSAAIYSADGRLFATYARQASGPEAPPTLTPAEASGPAPLAEVARGVSDRNDFSRRAPARGRHDELGILVTAFNQMLDGLERRDVQLREAHAELERRLQERTEAYRQAEEASRLKDEFLSTLSHELRTPLNAVVGWAALLVQGPLDDELHERAVTAIDRNARAQAKLINDVLDVSRIVAGKLYLWVEPVDLTQLVQGAIEALSHAAAAKQIEVRLEAMLGLDPILGDPNRLQQVMWNLLANAIKFTGRDGRVTVRLRRAGPDVEIEVEDDGIGIPPEFLPHVFERFRQADASSTRVHGGLGLGLAIVRHLVEMHGGTVRVHSVGRGRGATFTVTLPPVPLAPTADKRRQARQGPPDPDSPQPELHGRLVLVAAADRELRELARAALAAYGAEVLRAASAPEAMETLRTGRPDAIVHHVSAWPGDGDGLIEQLRALPEGRGGDIPVIALTRESRSDDRSRLLIAGYQGQVTLPLPPLELAALVASVAGVLRKA